MTNIVKLCFGVPSVQDLRDRIDTMVSHARSRGQTYEMGITTRTYPKRASEIIGKGSLFWVIKGQVCARQAITGIEQFTDAAGTSRCRIMLSPELVDVEPRPRRGFQGWRYLEAEEAPRDLSGEAAEGLAAMPDAMRRELADLGLL